MKFKVPSITGATFKTFTESKSIKVVEVNFKNSALGISNEIYEEENILYSEDYETDNFNSSNIYFNSDEYLEDLFNSISFPKNICEIGCGSGEFLKHLLQKFGTQSNFTGFDPIIKFKDISKPQNVIDLRPYYYNFEESFDLYIFRCVLNHFIDPLEYLEKIRSFNKKPHLILVEFPNIEFILENNLWNAIGNEHVHYFSRRTFERFPNLYQSEFGGGEWSVRLFLNKISEDNYHKDNFNLENLEQAKTNFLNSINPRKKYAVYSAAGKGTLMTYVLNYAGIDCKYAVDNNPRKNGRFLAASGARVVSPQFFEENLSKTHEIIVPNPVMFPELRTKYKNWNLHSHL